MRKRINGKSYDTSYARPIYSANFGDIMSLYGYSETLFQKRTGEFFLHGEGGAGSRYAVSRGENHWAPGEQIQPLTFEAAKAWLEKNADPETYQATFGPVEEEETTRTILSVSVDSATADRIRREAAEKGLTVSAVIASKFPAT